MTVSGIVKSSLIDFPGLVSCVLFVPGCNYDCFYCHNRALVDGPYEVLNPVYIREFLEKRAGLLDGVVISGGEPTLQPDLKQFAQTVKGLGYKLKLDTNGSPSRSRKGAFKSAFSTTTRWTTKRRAPNTRESAPGRGGQGS